MNFSRAVTMLCVWCQLSACALEASDGSLGELEASEHAAIASTVQAQEAFALPITLQIRDTTKDGLPTTVYTREGFTFRLNLTRTGATLRIENAADAALLIKSYRLSADCEGGWTESGNPSVAQGRVVTAEVRCRDGAIPSVASVDVFSLASSASNIGYRPPTFSPPGNAHFSFSGFPTELYAGDGSRAVIERVDANAIAGTFTNHTAGPLAVRIVLEGTCPESRFDELQVDDTGTQRVLPGASLDAVLRCLNGVPTPRLSGSSRPWDAALGASPEVTNVSP